MIILAMIIAIIITIIVESGDSEQQGDLASHSDAILEGEAHSEGVLNPHAAGQEVHECSRPRKLRGRGMLQPSKEHADEDHQHQDRRKHSKRIVIEEQDDQEQEQEQQATKRTYKEPSL